MELHHVITSQALGRFGGAFGKIGIDVAGMRSRSLSNPNIAALSNHNGYSAAHRGYSQGVLNELDKILGSKTTPAQQKAAVTAVMGALKDALISGHPDLNLATPAHAQGRSAAAVAAGAPHVSRHIRSSTTEATRSAL